jgi:PadR family transcriptional regulator, regulatory protein AphA
MPAELTTTSYAILGLLAIKPWTTYELTQQMDRAIGHFWPRTRSKLYEEPKKLVAHGMARASKQAVGSRPRTMYTITAKGRRALREWVPRPGEGPVLEFESLLKVFFAEAGSKEDLLATLDRVLDWVQARAVSGVEINNGYLNGVGPFPERLPWLILTGQFLDEFDAMVMRWAEWAIEVVRAWPDDIQDAAPDLATLEKMAVRNEQVAARLAKRRRLSAAG